MDLDTPLIRIHASASNTGCEGNMHVSYRPSFCNGITLFVKVGLTYLFWRVQRNFAGGGRGV